MSPRRKAVPGIGRFQVEEEVSYDGAHKRIRSARGRARDYLCEHCGGRAGHWAFDHQRSTPDDRKDAGSGRPYSLDPWRYLSLCHSCHTRFDLPEITHCPSGHEYTLANQYINPTNGNRACRECSRLSSRRWAARLKQLKEARAALVISHEEIRELDADGDPGAVIGWHLKGHHDLAAVEEFLLGVVDQGYRFAHIDICETWCRKVPTRPGWRFAYSGPGLGAYAVTRLDVVQGLLKVSAG